MAYFDLQLTESGDLQTRMENCLSSFKLSFTVSEFSSQRVSFMAEPSSFPKKINGQRITFNYMDVGNYKLQNESVDGIEEQVQALRITLRTELAETSNDEIGSTAYRLRHTIITNISDLEQITELIQNIVDDYLYDVTASLTYQENDKAGNFRFQSITVKLVDNSTGKKLTEFIF